MSSSAIISQRANFAARRFNLNQVISSATSSRILFNNELIDTHNQYNESSGLFTCTIPGVYQFNTTVRFESSSSNLVLALIQFVKNSSLTIRGQENSNVNGTIYAVSQSYLSRMEVGETLEVSTTCTTSNASNIIVNVVSDSFELAHFSGFKID